MKKSFALAIFSVVIFAVVSGCSTLQDFLRKDSPRYDQELVYDKPYDYTYLKTLEALDTFPDWILEETDKVNGLIVLRNTQFGHLFDKDKWVARFNVKSLGRMKTSVSLDPSTQQLVQGGELLKRIDQVMAASSAVKGEQLSNIVN